ncbi:allophanate hydrolase subunit 1 [Pseudooceanicola sp. CBS1P-1]|uniref:Carboxyltransferase domain-containing protein n=1 Tax=Pseudooceanicola albus TaxID=2692189 RepID=A0A6L7FZE5_9RHOB|nr:MULTISPECIES: carboxyltransferase domain-containing protein [Pseudooceanicola]MBT9382642.1 allophanate hydrolase subunit 1 [Pseudooceanicola endophyticus]MXN17181.1 carboxyltransferase domain-containing protein [Pseudooceanicola albus]
MTRSAPAPDRPRLLPLGLDGFLMRFSEGFGEAANRAAQAAGELARSLPGVTEVVPALASTLVRFDPARTPRAPLEAALRDLLASRDWLDLPPAAPTRRWHVPVSFDAADAPSLAQVAALTERTETALVQDILDSATRVLAIGFAPGQPYLGLLPEVWDFPRQTSLMQVPQGALVAAIRQLVLFANASPTGWLQIGRTAFRPFQPEAETPMPLATGDEIRFARASAAELAACETTPMGGARLEIL